MKHYDISPELRADIAVFPGDHAFRQEVSLHVSRGDHLSLSSISTTLHAGAHVDAPIHYTLGGQDISSRSLDYYLGEAQVISVRCEPGARIYPRDLATSAIRAPRILLKTGSFPDPYSWRDNFNSCSAELIDLFASRGVKLVGIDTPSIDPADCKTLESHCAVARHDLAILEGIVLSAVPDGIYTLIALPLKIKDGDASPVRAILTEEWGDLK